MSTEKSVESAGENLILALIGVVAAILLVLSPWLVDQSGPDPYYKGPLIYPQLVLGIIALASIQPALRFLRRGNEALGWQAMPRRSLGIFLLMCLYPFAIALVGLPAASFLAVGLGLRITGTAWRLSVLIAAGMAVTLWFLFIQLLDIWFPEPWLFGLFES